MSNQDALFFQAESKDLQRKLIACETRLLNMCRREDKLLTENKKLREKNNKLTLKLKS